MTDILLINPNTTSSITDLVLKTAKRFASKGTNLRAVTGAFGPRYIASRVGYAIAGHAAVDAFANDRHAKDAVVLACFGDPGLAALKEIARAKLAAGKGFKVPPADAAGLIGRARTRAFADLSIVNELDVYERSPEIAEKAGDYFRSVFPAWAPITSPAVMADARRVLGF